MMQSLNIESRLPDVGTTIFTVMSALAEKHKALNLSQGFPDFDCDARLKSLVEHHIRAGHNQYAPLAGLPALREVLTEKIRTERAASRPVLHKPYSPPSLLWSPQVMT
jgi:methionine aminotransferase